MGKFGVFLKWAGIVLLGLAHGVLEDLMFLRVLVEYMLASWDLTGDLFFTFTVPLAQLLVLAITGTFAWFVLGLHELPKLITFSVLWLLARAFALYQFQNPVQDIVTYLAWIVLWCCLLGFLAYFTRRPSQGALH